MSATETRRWSPRRTIITTSILVIGVLLAVGIWWVTGGLNSFRERPLKDLLSYSAGINPREATAEVCTEATGSCVEGWRTDVGDFQRFDSVGEAEYWELVLGDEGLRNGTIVLNMTGVDLSLEQKRQAVDVLFSDRDWN